MHYHQNHMWCSQSHWDGKSFRTSYMISIDSYDGRRQFPSHEVEDWSNLLVFKDVWCQEVYDESMARFSSGDYNGKITPDQYEVFASVHATKHSVPFLKQEVIDWLNENVADDAKPDDQPANGWCMGNDDYRSSGSSSLGLWFYRRRDALAFVKRWSVHKKCTTYFDYFNEIRKELIDGKLVKIEY